MSANSIYRDVVIEDGKDVLYEVTSKLYKGNNLRPDIYFKLHQSKNYNAIFNSQQRQIIENTGSAECYEIDEGAQNFDISLHALIAEHMCGLSRFDSLYMKVVELKDIRNEVCHGLNISYTELNFKLQELLDLYRDIIKKLEEKTGDNLTYVVMRIERKVNVRMEDIRMHHERMPNQRIQHQRASTSSESSEMPTWGKVALGVGAGVAVLGLVGAMAAKNDEKKKPDKKQSNNTEECVVM